MASAYNEDLVEHYKLQDVFKELQKYIVCTISNLEAIYRCNYGSEYFSSNFESFFYDCLQPIVQKYDDYQAFLKRETTLEKDQIHSVYIALAHRLYQSYQKERQRIVAQQ